MQARPRPSIAKAWCRLLLGGCSLVTACSRSQCVQWPAWQDFNRAFISDGGRVIDRGTPNLQTVSEAQAYAMFFALVANDRAHFDRLLGWTRDNLAQGDLTAHLPAWLWGRRNDGSWGRIDDNPAADADLWLTYDLHEAGRLWHEPRYSALAALLGKRILREETAELPGLGKTLLPAPRGFTPAADTWRLNPSYLPVLVLRRLAADAPGSDWTALLASSLRVIVEASEKGFAPDWVLYRTPTGFAPDIDTHGIGSYDAIRVYLWAGMLAVDDPARAAILAALRPAADYTSRHGVPPATADTATGHATGAGPAGFSAALIPLLDALGLANASREQTLRVEALNGNNAAAYYDRVLNLFGQGWHDGYFSFSRRGYLSTRWTGACATSTAH